ncbi:unnamed protein product, partial [Iphiclides podalirius]
MRAGVYAVGNQKMHYFDGIDSGLMGMLAIRMRRRGVWSVRSRPRCGTGGGRQAASRCTGIDKSAGAPRPAMERDDGAFSAANLEPTLSDSCSYYCHV